MQRQPSFLPPQFHKPPHAPFYDLADKEYFGQRLGVPRHLCHLIEHVWAFILPDTPTCQCYAQWYRDNCGDLPWALSIVNAQDWCDYPGQVSAKVMDTAIHRQGRPSVHWRMVHHMPHSELVSTWPPGVDSCSPGMTLSPEADGCLRPQ